MIERFRQKQVQWIDLYQPTKEEVRQIVTEFSLDPALALDLQEPVPRSEAVRGGKTVKLTMDFPVVHRTDITEPHEIKFLVAKEYLITVRYEDIGAVDSFKKEFEVLTTLHRTSKSLSGVHLFLSLMNELYSASASKLDYLQSKLAGIEDQIYTGHEKEMVFQISQISRKLITFKQTLRAHDDVFRDAKVHFEEVFKRTYADELEDLHMHYFHIARRTAGLFETLEDFKDTNLALLYTKQNEIMKILTIMAFVTFPLSLFASLFGMNTWSLPLTGFEGDFWVIVGIMVAATICFFIFFKYKKWM